VYSDWKGEREGGFRGGDCQSMMRSVYKHTRRQCVRQKLVHNSTAARSREHLKQIRGTIRCVHRAKVKREMR
jgi:hypothetical protein